LRTTSSASDSSIELCRSLAAGGGTVLGESHPKNANGTSDVLDSLLAAINELDVELAVDLLANASGHANAARLRQCFEPRRDIDSVAGNIVPVDDDVAEVDADA